MIPIVWALGMAFAGALGGFLLCALFVAKGKDDKP